MTATAGSRPQGEVRRAELLNAARRVVARLGFAGATVGEITREAGASLGLLNYHFGSRDQVVAEVFATVAREDLEGLAAIADAHDDAPRRLAAYLDQSAWTERESWRVWIDAFASALRTEAMRETVDAFRQTWCGVLARVLADGVHDGDWACADPDDAAARLVAVMDGIGLHATLYPSDVTPERATAWLRTLAGHELGITLPPSAPLPVAPETLGGERAVALRASDLDVGGHVSAAARMALLDEARTARAGGLLSVARVTVTHLRPLTLDDGPVLASCVVRRVGHSTVRTLERLRAADGEVATRAEVTLIAWDDAAGRPRPLTAAERRALVGP